jgi:hypothetical protein
MEPSPPPPRWPTTAYAPAPATDAKAVLALVLGILSLLGPLCWLGLPLGIPAIVFGALARRDIRRSEGLSRGSGMAVGGIVCGGLGSLLFLGYIGFMAYAFIGASSVTTTPPPPPPPAVTPPSPAATLPPGGWGRIHVVDMHSTATPLPKQLADEVRSATAAGEVVLVETTARACSACGEIALAMREPPLQAVLASARLVRVDVDELAAEIGPLHMKEGRLPWFYLLDARGTARDAISADEWDDNEAAEIAPVLDDFLKGHLKTRRRRWRGTTL